MSEYSNVEKRYEIFLKVEVIVPQNAKKIVTIGDMLNYIKRNRDNAILVNLKGITHFKKI